MSTARVFNRQTGIIAVAVALLLATFISALVSAAQVTERSVQLSSSSTGVTGVEYTVNFTPTTAGANSFVVDFCGNSPLVEQTCDAPVGLSVATAAIATADSTDFSVNATAVRTDNKLVIDSTAALDAGTPVSVGLTGVTNPTEAGAMYARIVTYDTPANAALYVSDDLKLGSIDQGGVAMSITPTVAISGDVLESMTFCMSAPANPAVPVDPITDNCGGTLVPPVLKLGNDIGGVVALDTDDIYTGIIYTQISTNASQGAVISLKSSTPCGGLMRAGTAICDIAPAGIIDPFVAAQAKFGMMLGADVIDATNGDIVAASASYNNTDFRFNYVGGNATGVTSAFGDPILTTNNKLANNRNMPLTFGASAANNTPAGAYSTDISLIATGKF